MNLTKKIPSAIYYAVFQDQKPQDTAGGTSSVGANTRVLNTTVFNNIPSCSLGSNQITLPAGTYKICAMATVYDGVYSQLTLYNVTDSALSLVGLTNYPANTVQFHDHVEGIITITGTKVFTLVHYIYNGLAGNGLGVGANYNTEVYASITIEKIA